MAYTTINKSTDYFNTKLYTGTGSSNALTGVGFQPDWVWIKNRTQYSHQLYDVIRGVTKKIFSNNTDAEDTDAQGLTAFGTDGFTVGTNVGVNANSENHVAWSWKAGGTGSANSDGSISSTVSANTTAGFSIVKWTGTGSNATVGHGLGSAPKFIIVKNYSRAGENWRVGILTGATSFTGSLQLDNTGAYGTASNIWNDTAPTSSVFSVGTAQSTNYSGDNLIAYCFAEKTGFSKFGSYTGNADADGPFVFTGFKPAFVLVKNSNKVHNWFLSDSKRLGYNAANHLQKPNLNGADDTGHAMDFLSNGFKVRGSSENFNGSGDAIIYMAFAEAPLVGSNNVPCTAR